MLGAAIVLLNSHHSKILIMQTPSRRNSLEGVLLCYDISIPSYCHRTPFNGSVFFITLLLLIMKTTLLKINPQNPRFINDENFKQLIKSIEDFPNMMKLRPIVVIPEDDNYLIIGIPLEN